MPPKLNLKPLQLHPELSICDIDLSNGSTLESLQHYFDICCRGSELTVTTSCFAEWKKGKNSNGSAKVIPGVPKDHTHQGKNVRVFFFDDNINLNLGSTAGAEDSKGICNLRDVTTGEYIDFSAGRNGFSCDSAFRHTLIHHSTKYNNVLVQANILDAMSNIDYFRSLVRQYSRKGEHVLVYMDVNGTILWSDSIMDLGPKEVLLGTMLMFTEVRPKRPFDVIWEDQPPVRLEQKQVLKQLMHDIAQGDNATLHDFWHRPVCERFMNVLLEDAELGWVGSENTFSAEEFFRVHMDYMDTLRKQDQQGKNWSGITASWFRCLSFLQRGGHSTILNSFGMDTHKVVLRSARDARRVLHIAVNFDTWSEKDSTKFREQFEMPLPPPPPRCMGYFQCEATSTTCTVGGQPTLEVPDYVFSYGLRKPSMDSSLGAKVVHVSGGLEVAAIVASGVLESSNVINKASVPPREVIRIGDIIREVNSITGDTKAMVEECRSNININMVVARPLRLMNPIGLCGGQQEDPYDEELVVTKIATSKRSARFME